MKVLLIGHACSPGVGSEASFTWNWAWQLSGEHQVWAIAHPYYRKCIDVFLANHPSPKLRFEWLDVPRWMDPWASRAGDRRLRFHYLLWLRSAYKTAMKLHQRIGFDIVHHVSYGSLSAPPPFWRLPVPFIWGPIGGAQQTPSSFREYFGRAWAREFSRNARVRLLPHSLSLKKAARASAVLLATNHDTSEVLRKIGGRDVRLFLDSGLTPKFVLGEPVSKPSNDSLTLLWVGRMQP